MKRKRIVSTSYAVQRVHGDWCIEQRVCNTLSEATVYMEHVGTLTSSTPFTYRIVKRTDEVVKEI